MWNPFKAIGGAIAGAGKAVGGGLSKAVGGIGKAVGGGLSKAGGAMTKAGDKLAGKAPKAPPAPKAPTKAPAAPTRVMPTVQAPKTPPPSAGKKLPPSMAGGPRPSGGMARDDAILGADSDAERGLQEAIKEFEAEQGHFGMSMLGKDAMDFLARPSFSAIFDKYAPGGGFAPDQWTGGMKDPHNFRITRAGDHIKIDFDADFDIDGDSGDIGGRSPYATF